MSAYTDAALFYGLLTTAAVVPPLPFDVRFGVAVGDGTTGTLTLPVVGDVRRGIQYGGDGDEFTGTLFTPVTDGADWRDDMDELFEEMRRDSEYRAECIYNGQSIIGVKLPLSLGFTMKESNYTRKADTSVDFYRSELVTVGLYALASARNPITTRPKLTVNGQEFIVLDCKDDNDTDPTVKLILSALQ